jgi:RNA-directed DNA polymerase
MHMSAGFKVIDGLLASLPESLRQAADSEEGSITLLRQLAEQKEQALREAMDACGRAIGADFPRLARNLTATITPAGGEVLACFLRHWADDPAFEPRNEHLALLEAIPPARSVGEVIYWLLAEGSVPACSTVSAFFHGSLRASLLFELQTGPPPRKRTDEDTARFLKQYFGTLPRPVDSDTCSTLLAAGFRRGLKRISERALKKLPAGLRRWILSDAALIKGALEPALSKRLLADPEGHPDLPQARARASWLREYPIAIEDLRSGRFLTPRVHRVLRQDRFNEDCYDEILDALRHGMKVSGGEGHPQHLPYKASFIRPAMPRLAGVVSFFASTETSRLSAGMQLPPKGLRQLIRDVTRPEWISAVLRCDRSELLTTFRPAALRQPWLREEVLSRLGEPTTSYECRSVFWRDALKRGRRESVNALLADHPHLLRSIKPEELKDRRIVRLLAGHLGDRQLFMNIRCWAEDALKEALMKSPDPLIGRSRLTLLRIARRAEDAFFRCNVLKAVLIHNPSLLAESPPWLLSDEEFDRLAGLRLGKNSLSTLFNLKVAKGLPAWERRFRKEDKRDFIRRKIRRNVPQFRPRLRQLEAFLLLENPKFRTDLSKVLSGKASPASLGVPHQMLRGLIPWVRRNWRKKPTLAVAYELALAFSLADARYLAFLCTERWKSPEKFRGGHVFDHHYRVYSLPKKSGGNRQVTVPSDALKRLQRRILRTRFDEMFFHPAAHGFRPGRSILTNSLPHVGQPCVVNVDIRSFFPSTPYPLILHACSMLAGGVLSDAACRVLADICSHGGGLPTGAPTSPALANLILRAADTSIAKAAAANNINYTRYADDLTFSGASNVLQILPFVARVLGQIGYQLDEKKTNIFRQGRRQMVTGLVVNVKPNLPRSVRRRLRAAVHYMANGKQPSWHGSPISGIGILARLGHLALVQPEEAAALRQVLKRCQRKGGGSE